MIEENYRNIKAIKIQDFKIREFISHFLFSSSLFSEGYFLPCLHCESYNSILFLHHRQLYLFLHNIQDRMLLIKSTEKVKLQNKARKILKMSTAVNGFLYVTTDQGNIEKLVHINKEGKVLWQRDYVDSVDTFGMFNEREAIVMNVNKSKIEIVDLLTHTIRDYDHHYSFEDTAPMEIYTFADSKLFAILEKGDAGDNRLIITYYSYQSDTITLINNFTSTEDWSCDMNFEKVNNKSKFAWWKPKLDGEIEFCTYNLNLEGDREGEVQGALRKVSVKNTLKEKYGLNNLSIEIGNMWETESDIFLLVCNTNRPDSEPEAAINNNYILDLRKETIEETKFTFPGKWNRMLMDYYNLGEISAFHTFGYEKGLPLTTPVYYVHNQRQEIIATETWQATCWINFFIPGFDTSTVIEAKHATGDVDVVEVTTKRLVTPHEMYLHFMLHINEDFDDDLLHDAIQLLTDRE